MSDNTVIETPETLTSLGMCNRLGVSYRKVDYWTRTGLLIPLPLPYGYGCPRQYPVSEITVGLVIVDCLDLGVSLQRLRPMITELRTVPDPRWVVIAGGMYTIGGPDDDLFYQVRERRASLVIQIVAP